MPSCTEQRIFEETLLSGRECIFFPVFVERSSSTILPTVPAAGDADGPATTHCSSGVHQLRLADQTLSASIGTYSVCDFCACLQTAHSVTPIVRSQVLRLTMSPIALPDLLVLLHEALLSEIKLRLDVPSYEGGSSYADS